MRKLSLFLLIGGSVLTVFFTVVWVLGFGFAGQTVGSLIHLLIPLAMLTALCAFVGLVLLIISLVTKK